MSGVSLIATSPQCHVPFPVTLQPSTWMDWIKGQQVHGVIELRSGTKVFTNSAMFNCIWDWSHANSSLLVQEVRKSGTATLNCQTLLEEDAGMYAKKGQKVYHAKMQGDQSILWTDIQICLKLLISWRFAGFSPLMCVFAESFWCFILCSIQNVSCLQFWRMMFFFF